MTGPAPRPAAPYGDFQLEIYLAGLGGTVPGLPVSFAELESRAAHALPPSVLSYVAGGAGDEHTQRANVAAFSQWGLMPRMLVGASERDLSVDLFGLRLPSPVFWVTGWRPRDLATSNFPQLRGFCLANYTSDPVFRARLAQSPEENPMAAVAHWAGVFGNPLTWDDLPWLRSLTSLPLILKGICHADDARRALDAGADGIYVSNHGGRQANGGLPALHCLPGVVEASAGRPVLFDSGIRSGADIVKAIALGATAVGIGRPYAYGLALGGAKGVEHVLRCLLAEADLIMAVDGYPALAGLTPDALRRVTA
jgi:isopentenyl diphosphate isomerase/L-lactate dehydrogenase-like FMN-dependent dehydrogenase